MYVGWDICPETASGGIALSSSCISSSESFTLTAPTFASKFAFFIVPGMGTVPFPPLWRTHANANWLNEHFFFSAILLTCSSKSLFFSKFSPCINGTVWQKTNNALHSWVLHCHQSCWMHCVAPWPIFTRPFIMAENTMFPCRNKTHHKAKNIKWQGSPHNIVMHFVLINCNLESERFSLLSIV